MTCHLDKGSLLYGGRGARCVCGASAWWTGVLAQWQRWCRGLETSHHTISPFPPPILSPPLQVRVKDQKIRCCQGRG